MCISFFPLRFPPARGGISFRSLPAIAVAFGVFSMVPRVEAVTVIASPEDRIIRDTTGDGLGDSFGSVADTVARVGEAPATDDADSRYYLPFGPLTPEQIGAILIALDEPEAITLHVSLGAKSNVAQVDLGGESIDLEVDVWGYENRTTVTPTTADYQNSKVVLLHGPAVAPATPNTWLSFDVTDFVRREIEAGNSQVAFRLQVNPPDVLPNADGLPNRYLFHTADHPSNKPFIKVNAASATAGLLGTDGFRNTDYPGSVVLGRNAILPCFEGAWTGTTAVATQLVGPSLGYVGYTTLPDGTPVTAGNRRLRVDADTELTRCFLTGNNGPLANFVDPNRAIGRSANRAPLYMAFLARMVSFGEAPTVGSFYLSNGGSGPEELQFRITYTADRIETAAGPFGGPATLAPRDGDTKLFVLEIGFAEEAGAIRVWVDPALGEGPPPPQVVLNHEVAFDRLGLSFSVPPGAVGAFEFDELRIGSSWEGVMGAEALAEFPGPVPQPAPEEHRMHGFPPSPRTDGLYPSGFFPMFDRFGQYRHLDWRDKIESEAELLERTAAERQELAAFIPPGRSRYGGWSAGPQLYATGFFRTVSYNGNWWLVDPDGFLFFSNGITTVGSVVRTDQGALSSQKTGLTGREHFFADLPRADEPPTRLGLFADETATVTSGHYRGMRPKALNFFAANALFQFPDATSVESLQSKTNQLAFDRLRSWGFNTVAGWSDSTLALHPGRMPYTPVLFPTNPPGIGASGLLFPDYFRDDYAGHVRSRLQAEAGVSLGDPCNVGYFINNEPEWAKSSTDAIDVGLATLQSPRESLARYAKQAFVERMQARHPTIGELNARWGADYASWQNMLDRVDVSFDVDRARDDLVAFGMAYVAQYFRTNRDAVREVAPGHLYLGSRFTSGVGLRPEVSRAAIEFCDVFSLNRYGAEVTVFEGMEANVPIIVSEYATWTTDTGLFGPTQGPLGSEASRPATFGNQLSSAVRHPRYVGAHWFQYYDFPPSGRLTRANNNSNYGFVQVTNTPYRAMIDEARRLGYSIYELRAEVGAKFPRADAYVRSGAGADENFGLAAELKVGLAADSSQYATHLKFDLSEIDRPVDRAIMELHPTQVTGSPVVRIAEVLDDSWGETSLTWNNQPGEGLPFGSLRPVAGHAVGFDVTEQLNAALAAGRELTLGIFHQGGEGMASWGSREGAAADRPQLRLVSGPADLETWRQQYFPPGLPEGADGADASGDGVSNLLKYALGLNPVVSSTRGLPRVSWAEDGSVSISFYRARPDLVYTVETSANLESWTVLAVNPGEVGRNANVWYPVNPWDGARFFRLRVSPNPNG